MKKALFVVFISLLGQSSLFAEMNAEREADLLVNIIKKDDLSSLKAKMRSAWDFGPVYKFEKHPVLKGRFLLALAAGNNAVKIAEYLIGHENVNRKTDGKEQTALHYAVKSGNIEITKALLANGANVNVQDYLGWTPAHYAAHVNRINLINLLEDAGADFTIKSKNNKTPAQMKPNSVVSEYLNKKAKKEVELMNYIKYKDLSGFNEVMASGFDEGHTFKYSPSLSSIVGRPILFMAVGNRAYEIVDEILQAGVDPTKQIGLKKKSAIFYVSDSKMLEKLMKAATYMKKAKEFINAQDSNGMTALHYAAYSNKLPLAKLLVESGADLNIRSYGTSPQLPNKTPAELKPNTEVSKYLITIGIERALEPTSPEVAPPASPPVSESAIIPQFPNFIEGFTVKEGNIYKVMGNEVWNYGSPKDSHKMPVSEMLYKRFVSEKKPKIVEAYKRSLGKGIERFGTTRRFGDIIIDFPPSKSQRQIEKESPPDNFEKFQTEIYPIIE